MVRYTNPNTTTRTRRTVRGGKCIMAAEKKQKYFVNRKELLTIRCRSCGKERSFPIDLLKDKKHSLNVTCVCAQSFAIELEFRQDFRKKTEIAGTVRPLATPKDRARHCTIADHSTGGLLLELTEKVPVRKDDKLIVSYQPDTGSALEVERVIAVRHLDAGTRIGCAFVDDVSGYRA